MATKINVEGRRLIKEKKDALIGEINESVDEIKDTLTNDVAFKDEVKVIHYYEYNVKPGYNSETKVVTFDEFNANIPVLKTDKFTPETDTKFGNNPIIDVNKGTDARANSIYFKGFFAIRDTANDRTRYYCTTGANSSYQEYSLPDKTVVEEIVRYGSNNWKVLDGRYNRLIEFVDPVSTESIFVDAISQADGTETSISADSVDYSDVGIKILPPKAGKNYAQLIRTPIVEGTYTLQCTVDSNGQVDTFTWVPVEE